MSSFTGLFSSGGGETNIVTDPRKLPRIAASSFLIKVGSTGYAPATGAGFFTAYLIQSDRSAFGVLTASDTYLTLLDVSNSFGGFLNWVLSPEITTTNNISTVKITVDDVPYEFSYQYNNIVGIPSGNRARMIIGGGWSTAQLALSSGTAAGWIDVLNNFNDFGFDVYGESQSNWDDPVNKVYGAGQTTVNYVAGSSTVDQAWFPKLRFNSSLKVEVKQQTLSTSNVGHYSACHYTLH